MMKRDYSEDEDFYTQGFERQGVVSVWLELNKPEAGQEFDALQDLCGVGYYNLDKQDSDHFGAVVGLDRLLSRISYSESFSSGVIVKANAMGIASAYWVLVQFDFDYDPSKVQRSPTGDLVFVGVFPYVATGT